jgi:hypothetical protein
VVFGLALAFDALDTETGEVGAQPCQRPFMKKTGQIIGPVGHQFTAPDPDEEIEIFARDRGSIFLHSRSGQCPMRKAERRPVALELRQFLQQRRIRWTREKCRKQRIFLSSSNSSVVDRVGCPRVEVRSQHSAGHARRCLDRDDAVRRHARPIEDGGLRDTNAARQLGDAARGPDRLAQPRSSSHQNCSDGVRAN